MIDREAVLRGSTANCKLCKETPIPDNYGSSRLCAFNEKGEFNPRNWNCETANGLREAAGEGYFQHHVTSDFWYTRREDQSYAALFVPPHPQDVPDGNREGPFRGGGFIAMTWYKMRGEVELMVRVDGYDPVGQHKQAHPLTLIEAEAALENLKIAKAMSQKGSKT